MTSSLEFSNLNRHLLTPRLCFSHSIRYLFMKWFVKAYFFLLISLRASSPYMIYCSSLIDLGRICILEGNSAKREAHMPSTSNQPPLYQQPAQLLQELIRFDTTNPPGNEVECVSYINYLLTEVGFQTSILARDPMRPNLVARLKGRGNAPGLLLQGHIDVVTTEHQQWQHPPFEGTVADGYIWGRGTLDMKGGVAMMLA